MSNWTLFGSAGSNEKPADDRYRKLRVLITVKAAPNPSATYGETVCIAGVSGDAERPGWIRLYPVNFRSLESDHRFAKYNLVTVSAKPARDDPRFESWKPQVESLEVEGFVKPWTPRRPWLDPYIDKTMCEIQAATRGNPRAPSLALVRVRELIGLEFEEHPGWNKDEQEKIDGYIAQLGLFGGSSNSPLEAPALKGFYRWRCMSSSCRSHRQGILDWEFVALQRRLLGAERSVMREQIAFRFMEVPSRKTRELSFYVGNQAKRTNVFSVLGLYYPS